MTRFPSLRRLAKTFHSLHANTAGLALIEFAYGLPLLLGIGLGGVEISNLAVTRLRVSQLGMSVADNMARVGTSNGLALKKVYESDVADVFEAARLQGVAFDPNFLTRTRIIVSTLQQNAAGGQWIAWQRCYGSKTWPSSYGVAGDGRTNTTFAGMGPTASKITATPSNAVIFVEIAYDYQAIVQPFAQGLQYFGLRVNNQVITYKSAYIVRDPRELGTSTATSTTANDYGLFQNTPALVRKVCT